MKIAYLSRGNSVYDRRFLEKMVERGHEPHFISYYPCEHVQVAGVQNYFYDYTKYHFNHLVALRTAWQLRRLLYCIQPDVLHTGWVQDHGFFGALSGFHPTLSMPWGSDILTVPNASFFGRWVARFTLKRADMITCDCELVKQKIMHLVGYPAEKIVVFPWGIDLNVFKPSSDSAAIRKALGWEDKRILIMTRQFKPVYGIEYFIDALPLVIRQRPETRVILVGTGPLENAYRQRISALGLDKYVHFAGWLNESAMVLHLNAADIYVTTSLSDGTSASLLEAMACGLPVIVSDAPAYAEWVQEGVNGFIVPRKDSTVLPERIIEFLDDDCLRQEMGNHNQQIAQKRANWESNFDTLQRIYETLAKR